MAIDLQVHFCEQHSKERPHLNIAMPNLPYPFGPNEMLPLMKDAGVEHVVIVPPGFMGDNNIYALECVKKYPENFSVMGLVDINNPQLKEDLANWLNQPGMIGIRTHLSKRMRDRWASEQQADILWQSCSEYQIPVAVFSGGETSYLENVLKKHPKLFLIIDHFGLGPIDTSIKYGIDYQSFRDMMSLSKYSNVYIKVSTLPVRSSSDYPFTDMHQVVQETIKSFRPERMLWATDFTQSLNRNGSTYIEEVNFWRSGMPFLTQTDIDAILSMNAKKIFPQLNN